MLSLLFETQSFPARWNCGQWASWHGWTHILSDLGIWSAYMAIPFGLMIVVRKKRELPFRRLFWLFVIFILACGTTHLIEAIIFWKPVYYLAGLFKFITAVVSWLTVITLLNQLSNILAMPTPKELAEEVRRRRDAESNLKQANEALESRVQQRTQELSLVNHQLAAERERHRITLQSLSDGIIAVDARNQITFMNPAAEKLCQAAFVHWAGQPANQLLKFRSEDGERRIDSPTVPALASGQVVASSSGVLLASELERAQPVLEYHAAPILDSLQQTAGAVMILRDVSAQREVEQRQQDETHWNQLLAEVSDCFGRPLSKRQALLQATQILQRYLNAKVLRLWVLPEGSERYELRAAAGQEPTECTWDEDLEVKPVSWLRRLVNRHTKLLLCNAPQQLPENDHEFLQEHSIRQLCLLPLLIEGQRYGVIFGWTSHKWPCRFESDSGRLAELFANFIQRRRAEMQLQQSRERYRLFFESNPLPMWVYDRETLQVLEVNYAATLKYGYTREEFLSLSIQQLRPTEEWPRVLESMSRVEGPTEHELWRHRTKQGGELLVRVRTQNLVFQGRAARLVQAQDVTQQIVTEKALQHSEERFRRFMNHSPTAAWIIDAQGVVRYRSDGMKRLLQTPPLAQLGDDGETIYEWFEPADQAELEKVFQRVLDLDKPVTASARATRKEGSAGHFLIYAFPLPMPNQERVVGGLAVDVTELRTTEAALRDSEDKLRQAQKMESIGLLAGGVAHDFNNLLTVVSGCGELLLQELQEHADARNLLEAILSAADRGATLTRQLLTFSRQQVHKKQVVDVHWVMSDLLKMLERLLPEHIRLNYEPDPEAGFIEIDLSQLELLVVNLVVNARDAMPQGGHLRIAITRTTVEQPGQPHPDARPGEYLRLQVSDTGQGIPQEYLPRIFEPFFTTKSVGRGTGLGLAMVYGIVQQSHGFIIVTSEIHQGTTFDLYFPRVPGECLVNPEREPESSLTPGHETILIVEDDAAVRTVASAILKRQGYEVLLAEDGAEALELCQSLSQPPDLMITDVVMPGLSGRELADQLAARYPQMKMIFLSGYTADRVLKDHVEQAKIHFLQKPYKAETLIKLVREVLDRG